MDLMQTRPPFMAVLGLLPPLEMEDVKAAYKAKALEHHPDRGGNPAQFIRVKDAYQQALEFVAFQGSRREWIAARVEPYLEQEAVIAEVLRRGGRVELERFAWMEKSWGDGFPLLAERLRHIYVRNMDDGDDFLEFLEAHRPPYLMGLDLSGSRITRNGLERLAGSEVMRWLDLSGTGIQRADLESLLSGLSVLERLNVRRTRLGMLGRWRLGRAFPQIRVVSESPQSITPGSETIDFNY